MKTLGLFLLAIVAAVVYLKHRDAIEREDDPAAVATSQALPQTAGSEAPRTPGVTAPNRNVPFGTRSPNANASAPLAMATDNARKFEVTIEQIIPGGSAVVYGRFFDIRPSETTEPERMDPRDSRSMNIGQFYISGLPQGFVDGQKWKGWLVREGAKTFTMENGSYRTMPAYRVVADPPAVPFKAKQGLWMRDGGRTMLDQPVRH